MNWDQNFRLDLNDGEWLQLKAAIESLQAIYQPATPVVVTGSRGGNAALANVLSAMAAAGLITDSTTP